MWRQCLWSRWPVRLAGPGRETEGRGGLGTPLFIHSSMCVGVSWWPGLYQAASMPELGSAPNLGWRRAVPEPGNVLAQEAQREEGLLGEGGVAMSKEAVQRVYRAEPEGGSEEVRTQSAGPGCSCFHMRQWSGVVRAGGGGRPLRGLRGGMRQWEGCWVGGSGLWGGCASEGMESSLSIPKVLRLREEESSDLRLLPAERSGVQHTVGLTPAAGHCAGGSGGCANWGCA